MSRFATEYRAAQYARREAEKKARIEAFAAIRRAATFARWCDAVADREIGVRSRDHRYAAKGVRYAIRVAIGSETR